MRALHHVPGRLALLAGLLVVAVPAPATAAPKRPPLNGNATITSVDGPGRLTLKTSRGPVKVRLFLIDTPEPGECGAAESTATLAKLAKRRGGRVRYVLWSRRPDAEGRMTGLVGPPRADLTEQSLAVDLVRREWARIGGVRTISESDGIVLSVRGETLKPRAPRGVWARCGGLMHLPANEPVPTHAPAPWTVTAEGVTESIGPLVFPTTLAPGSALTVAAVERVARVETTDLGEGTCFARVPSLELLLYATAGAGAPCRNGDVYAVSSSGPGAATLTRGLRVGQQVTDAPPLFPRLAANPPANLAVQEEVPLAGVSWVPWAWQTSARLDGKRGAIVGFVASAGEPN